MKKRTIIFIIAIAISAMCVMGYGAYLKYGMLAPLGIAQDKSIVELPFLLMTDDALRYQIKIAMDAANNPQPPVTEPPTEPTAEPTEPSTEPSTEPTTEPTEPSTEPTVPTTEPTVPPTEPTVPPTEPTVPPTEPTVPPTEPTDPNGDPTEPTEPPHVHAFERNGYVPATCIADGHESYICACGESYTSPIASPGHQYQEQRFNATCSSQGYSLFVCSVCGDSYQDNWTDPLDHNYEARVVAPTPSADGYTEYTCKDCGAIYRDQYTQYVPEPTQPTEPPVTEPTTPPETEPTTPPQIRPQPSDSYPGYDFSAGAVSNDWFNDVLFIGDSRTVGLQQFARSGNADYFCGVGLGVFNVTTTKCEDVNFAKQTLETLLSSKTYGKVFINLGLNDCGYTTSYLVSAYQDLINLIRQYQPNAKIIIQSIITVTKNYSSAYYFQPNHIFAVNAQLQWLSNGSTIFYIDANPYFTDADGYLYKNVTGDGCHFYANYYAEWAAWIHYAVGQLGI